MKYLKKKKLSAMYHNEISVWSNYYVICWGNDHTKCFKPIPDYQKQGGGQKTNTEERGWDGEGG